jgi:SAM-dependent methyltransferase
MKPHRASEAPHEWPGPKPGSAAYAFWHAVGRQLRQPTGAAGRVVGWLMAVLNEQPSRNAIEVLNITGSEAVLDLGFGPGRSLAAMAARHPAARLAGLDHSAAMLRVAGRRNKSVINDGRMTLVCGRFGSLPWSDNSFDKVLLLNVVYFFDLRGRDIADVFRVLRPGGCVVVFVTDRFTMDRWPFSGPATHRTFDADQLFDLLIQGGFPRASVRTTPLKLSFGIKGIIAVAHKPLRASGSEQLDGA